MAAPVEEQLTERLPAPAWPVLELLACPVCHGSLQAASDGVLGCTECERDWPERDGWLDFVTGAEVPLDDHWAQRQQSMEGWYENLITASDQAEECYRHDYEPLAPLLGELRGLVLDVGGGNGIVRQYLAPDVHYIDLDPSLEWLRPAWLQVASFFPALSSPITFARGVGERLPFRSGRMDAVLSLFSINHAADPSRLVSEALRVLRPGGRFLIVAEDVEPRWGDLASPGYRAGWVPLSRAIPDKLAATLGRRPWPVHPEHLRITERELRTWLRDGFELRRRSWIAGWLTLEATKR
jgi:SAM-dependent methyltransferase